ncbi:MAG: hypothetical protein ACXVDN_02340 [Ktedonobacteraceae bacterium]
MNSETDTQLYGYKLVLARTVWGILTVMSLVLWIADIPPGYAQYLTVCRQVLCQNQLATPDMVRALNFAGLTLQFYAIYITTLSVVLVLFFFAIGVIIAWRKSDDWMALLVSITLIILGTVNQTDYQQLASIYPFTQVPGDLLHFLFTILPFLVVFLFPNGRFVPRWTRWVTFLVILFAVGGSFIPASPLNTQNLPDTVNIALVLLLFVTVIFAQIYRYVRKSTLIERQQTKWIILGIAATFIYFIVLDILTTLNPELTQARSLGFLFAEASYFLAFIIVPLAIAFSILRYRLWDIDLLINRTLVYTTLTAILALIYFGCVVLLQHLVNGVTGQVGQSPLVIVASTLAIAALFSPLRRRIQKIIDKRFYRRRYDAAKIIATFSDTLRNEMDLNTLSEHLVAVVEETMQPASVSLWLRPSANQQVSWSATPVVPSEDEARVEK